VVPQTQQLDVPLLSANLSAVEKNRIVFNVITRVALTAFRNIVTKIERARVVIARWFQNAAARAIIAQLLQIQSKVCPAVLVS